MADEILATQTDERIGRCWANRFITCIDEQRMAPKRVKDCQRVLQSVSEFIDEWFKLIGDIIIKYVV